MPASAELWKATPSDDTGYPTLRITDGKQSPRNPLNSNSILNSIR